MGDSQPALTRIRLDDEPKEGMLTRMVNNAKKDPFLYGGMGGWFGVVGYALYNIRKSKTPLGLYLIHTRVLAQTVALGGMLGVVGWRVIKHQKKKYADRHAAAEAESTDVTT